MALALASSSRCGPPPTSRGRASRAPRAPRSAGLASETQPAASRVLEVGLSGGQRREVLLDGAPAVAGLAAQQHADAPAGPLTAVRDFFLPRGWPHSVTPDYLHYQLVSIPTHITGWMSHSLATSSMIKALGVDAGPAAVVATTAAIKWITKDGLGAAGRLIVGGRLASVFDEDPRRWRMVAEAVSTLGLSLEIATQVYPANFVLLAGGGTLAKSMAKGMGRPCFRVIQTHFSATNNVGDVAAKEEVWEVAAQLAGLACSVLLLQSMESIGHAEYVVPAWAAAHSVHVVLRYTALRTLRFPYPNQKRAALMTSAHVSAGRMPTIEEANTQESILLPPSACHPRVSFGCTLDEALPPGLLGAAAAAGDEQGPALLGTAAASSSNGAASSSNGASSIGALAAAASGSAEGEGGQQQRQLSSLLALYCGERFLLTWHSGQAWVLLREGAEKRDMLRAMWQAAWLEHRMASSGQLPDASASAGAAAAAASRNGSGRAADSSFSSNGAGPAAGGAAGKAEPCLLSASLEALQERWPDFEAQAEAAGWQLDKAVLPQGHARLRVE